MVDAAQLTDLVKPREIWKSNLWIWILQAEENYVRIQWYSSKKWTRLRSETFLFFLSFGSFSSGKCIPLPSLADIDILRDRVPDLRMSARLVTINAFNWSRGKHLPRNIRNYNQLKCLRLTLVFVWNSALREGLNRYILQFFCNYWQNFHN